MKHLTPAILYRAADLIRPVGEDGKLIFTHPTDPNDSYELYMCHAVTNAAKDLDADVAEVMGEFKGLLRYHRVCGAGTLDHTNLDQITVTLDDEPTYYSWATAQPVRFMFLEFLALSLE